jgi:hypothetical protein
MAFGALMINIGHAGTFDVASFGDLLYSVITSIELRRAGLGVITFAPTSAVPHGITGAPRTKSLANRSVVNGWIVGGGNLLAPNVNGVYGVNTESYYDSILVRPGSNCIWHSLGVMNNRRPLSDATRERLSTLTYCAVRDSYSKDYLSRYTSTDISVIPDIGFGLSRIWSLDDLQRSLSASGRARVAQPYLSVACRKRDVGDVDLLVKSVSRLALDHGIRRVMLIAASPCQGDDVLMKSVLRAFKLGSREVRCEALADTSILSISATLAFSAMHIGNSLHGGVIASCYRVPTIWVSQIAGRGNNKILGALRWTSGIAGLAASWQGISSIAAELSSSHAENDRVALLEIHWRRVIREVSAW